MSNEPQIKVFSGSSHPELAERIARHLGVPVSEMILSRFASNEIYARPKESVRNCEIFVVQTGTGNVNEDLMELFIMLDSFKRSFAHRVHVVMPYYPYARQDRVAEAREPISAKLIADLISTSGADHLITILLHSDQEQGFFDFPVDNLRSRKLFVDFFKKKKLKNIVVVAPDVGSAKEAKRFAGDIGAELAILNKERSGHNKSEVTHLVGNVKGRTCIVYDDLVDTAGSVCNAREAVRKAGARPDVYLAATHAVLSRDAGDRLARAGFKEIVFTDTIPLAPEKKLKNMKIISVAPLLSRIIRNVYEGKPLSPLTK
ncbi:MAG: ribose-phosphate pyrophosphokinase [Patescibacteria group bacterium]